MRSSCLAGNWKAGGGTWRMNCGCLTCQVEHGKGETQWSSSLPRPRFTLWRVTRHTASGWKGATLLCWSYLATLPSTATSAMFRSTTWVSDREISDFLDRAGISIHTLSRQMWKTWMDDFSRPFNCIQLIFNAQLSMAAWGSRLLISYCLE